MKCTVCQDCGWVCERHADRPWEGQRACRCGAPGMPCPACNATNDRDAPRMPEGFNTEVDKDGWRHRVGRTNLRILSLAAGRCGTRPITSYPRPQQKLPPWQAAAGALIMAAERRDPLLHARVGMLKAMNHGRERVFRTDRKETHWGKRKLKRDE